MALVFKKGKGITPGAPSYTVSDPNAPFRPGPADEYRGPGRPDYGGATAPQLPTGTPWAPSSGPTKSASSSSGSRSSTSTQTFVPSGPTPTMEAGTFAAPEYDEDRISALSQRFQAPGVRRLRREVRSATAGSYDNPNVKRMVLRDALAGYGQGLESVTAGAYKSALGQYGQEYGRAWDTAMTNFKAQESAKAQNFQTAMTEWQQTGTTVRKSGSGVGVPSSGATPKPTSYSFSGTPGTPSRGY
jgi:hypothetical protein